MSRLGSNKKPFEKTASPEVDTIFEYDSPEDSDFDTLIDIKSTKTLEKRMFSPVSRLPEKFWQEYTKVVQGTDLCLKSVMFGWIDSADAYSLTRSRARIAEHESGLYCDIISRVKVKFKTPAMEFVLLVAPGVRLPLDAPCVFLTKDVDIQSVGRFEAVIKCFKLPADNDFRSICGMRVPKSNIKCLKDILRIYNTVMDEINPGCRRYFEVALGLGYKPATMYSRDWLTRYAAVMSAPASCQSHGSASSGLIEHIGNMLEIARYLRSMFNDIKFDWQFLYLAILFHDLGKWDMYTQIEDSATGSKVFGIRDRVQDHSVSGIAYLGKIHEQVEPDLRLGHTQFNKLCYLIANLHDLSVGRKTSMTALGYRDIQDESLEGERLSDILTVLRSLDRLESVFGKYKVL